MSFSGFARLPRFRRGQVLKVFGDGVRGQLGNICAGPDPAPDGDQSAALKVAQGLADRYAADLELLDQFAFGGDFFSRLEDFVMDGLLDGLLDGLGKQGLFQGTKAFHQ